MPKQQSLADYLGLTPASESESDALPAFEKLTAKQFCQAVLNSREFRRYILNGILASDIPSQVLVRIMDTGWGKPVERVEMHDTSSPFEGVSAEELERRALMLAEAARRVRSSRTELEDDESTQVLH